MSTRICRFEKSTLLRLEHQNTVRVGAQCAPSHINGIRRDGARRAPDVAWPCPLSGSRPGSCIRNECATLVASTGKLKDIEHAAFTFVAHAAANDATGLSDYATARFGVPAQATRALTGICSAIVRGIVKHRAPIEQGDVSEPRRLFAAQLPSISRASERRCDRRTRLSARGRNRIARQRSRESRIGGRQVRTAAPTRLAIAGTHARPIKRARSAAIARPRAAAPATTPTAATVYTGAPAHRITRAFRSPPRCAPTSSRQRDAPSRE